MNRIDLTITRNDHIDKVFSVTNQDSTNEDLTTYQDGIMQMRTHAGGPVVLELTNSNNEVVLGDGKYQWKADKSKTDIEPGQYYYQVELQDPNGKHFTYQYGTITVRDDYAVL